MSGVLTSAIWRAIEGPPEKLPKPPKISVPIPIAPKAPPKVENAPGEKDITSNAAVADERRRILAGLPDKTKNTYAGEADAPVVEKKRLLGGGTTGKSTTGE